MSKPFDPLAFDDLRVRVVRALGRPRSPERDAELGTATRAILELETAHPAITAACAELGWRDELTESLARELASAADAPATATLASLGARMLALLSARDHELRAVVARTSDLLSEPASVVPVALGLATLAPGSADARGPTLVAIADASIDAWCRAHATTAPSGASLVKVLVTAVAKASACPVVHGLAGGARSEPRAVTVERIATWLTAWLAVQTSASRSLDAPTRTALSGWCAAALALLPRSDAAVRNAVRAVRHLPDEPSRQRAWFRLLGAAIPDAVASDDAVVVPSGSDSVFVLAVVHGAIVRFAGAADLEAALPESLRASFRAAVARLGLELVGRGVGCTGDGWHSFAERDAVPGTDVAVHVSHGMGDTTYELEVARPDTGRKVELTDEPFEMIAIDHEGTSVWHQRVDWNGVRTSARHELGLGPGPWPEHPPRAAVRLVSEILGPRCRGPSPLGDARFLFAEDVAPRQPLGVVLAAGVPRELADALSGRSLPSDGVAGEVPWIDCTAAGQPLRLVYASGSREPAPLSRLVARTLERCDRVIVAVPATPVTVRPGTICVATAYVDLGQSADPTPLGAALLECVARASADRTDLVYGTYGGDARIRYHGPALAVIGPSLGLCDTATLRDRVLVLALVTRADGRLPEGGLASGDGAVRLLLDTIALAARLRP
ncbi:MAG: hypothetical protein IT373_22345 [Polyangiaceae bacterium]|nr:hypothetical protein [Polyangiaceae bacterium]